MLSSFGFVQTQSLPERINGAMSKYRIHRIGIGIGICNLHSTSSDLMQINKVIYPLMKGTRYVKKVPCVRFVGEMLNSSMDSKWRV